jgi:hypothetical protein
MKPEIFWRSYPRAQEFADIVKKYNPNNKVDSVQARRLHITQ